MQFWDEFWDPRFWVNDNHPIDSNDILYIADEYESNVVWKFALNSSTLVQIVGVKRTFGSSPNLFYYPQDVHVDILGNVYVTDFQNSRVQKFSKGSTNGITIAGITGAYGSNLNEFNKVRYMYAEPNDTYIYIGDWDNHRIMRYSTDSTTGTNGVLVAGGAGPGNSNTQLYQPFGIGMMPSVCGNLFVSNSGSHSIMEWLPGAVSGIHIAGTPGTPGSSANNLNNPGDIRVDRYLNVFVADVGNHRVQLFCRNNPTGITIAGIGSADGSSMGLSSPRSIAFDSAMNLYVSDSNNKRIQKFLRL